MAYGDQLDVFCTPNEHGGGGESKTLELNDYIFELFATTSLDQIRLRIGAIPSKIAYFTETDCMRTTVGGHIVHTRGTEGVNGESL